MADLSLNDKEYRKFRDSSRGNASAVVDESAYTIKVTVSGSVTYVSMADPGTAQSEAKWQARKIDETTGTIITWADGNANFDNIATDLTSLSYS